MIFTTVFVIAVLFVLVTTIIQFVDWGLGAGLWALIWTSFCSALALLFVGGIISATSAGAPVYKTEVTTTELRAVSNGSELSGSFFLGSGNIKDEKVFSYLYDEDGWTRSGQVKASEAFVAEDATVETARLDKVKIYRNYWWAGQANAETRYEFHIPRNSIVENFQIEAK